MTKMKMVDDRPRKGEKVGKEIPQMPDGYYSEDKPNLKLKQFVKEHMKEHPYESENDNYNVKAFEDPITTKKSTKIYNLHNYWSKKPHDAISQYIKHYTQVGDLILDPFCGSGSTALSALLENRNAIAIDRSPAATFITKNYCTPIDVSKIKTAFEELKVKIESEVGWLYETRCHRCGGKATINYTVYSQVFQCPRCMEKVPLFDCIEVEVPTKKREKNQSLKLKKAKACPHCYQRGNIEIISSQSHKYGSIPVLIDYTCENSCKPKRNQRKYNDNDLDKREYFKKFDLQKINDIENSEILHWYPKGFEMTSFSRYKRDALYYYGVQEVSDLFTKRNLWALSAISKIAQQYDELKDAIMFSLTSILFSSSRMYLWTEEGQHGFISGTFYLPQVSREINVANQFLDKFKSLQVFKEYSSFSTKLFISTSSATNMDTIPSNSIDYIFTDPPYAGKIQYGELNYIWEAWLGFNTRWHEDEITINHTRNKTETDWLNMMHQSMEECYRVLKPGRWVSLCYHDTSEGTWSLIQDMMTEIGFVPDISDSPIFIDSTKKTYNQYNADKVTKRDLVVNFRKPKLKETSNDITIADNEEKSTFNGKVCSIIREHLISNPGATKDRVYDAVVSRMVRLGEMEPHDFDFILKSIAVSSDKYGFKSADHWYLKETELEITDTAEDMKEEKADQILSSFIYKYLSENPEKEGIHYSDIFEFYIYSVKDKPRRHLSEWLLDYYYKTAEGTYRPPLTEREKQIKKEGRVKGVTRRIKRHISFLENVVPISEENRPNDTTLAEWIHHCRRSGLYDKGKILYERGGISFDRLSEEQQIEVEENYQACIRALEREASMISGKINSKSNK